jgi:hypothetical protein
MGQRLIITEEEKKNIRLMYESSPPDESVLVTKKNPFKGLEFKTAQRFYNPNLKENEMFFTIDKNRVQDFLQNKVDQNFKGKSIRFFCTTEKKTGEKIETDHLYTLPESFVIVSDKEPLELNVGWEANDIYISYIEDVDELAVAFDNKIGDYKTGETRCKTSSDGKIKTLLDPILNIQNIPDEFFEIRKIQRRKTDF